MPERFSYDDSGIHEVYTKARELPQETIDVWIDAIAASISGPTKAILDLGCGEGRFSVALAKKFNAKVYGVDPSVKMLSVARKKGHGNYEIEYIVGSGEQIPLQDHQVSMVFMSMVYHHINDLERTTQEIWRVLTPNGYVVIRNPTKEDIMGNEMFDFFSSAKETELERMPYESEVISNFQGHGFALVDKRTIDQIFAQNYMEFYEKISQRGLSILRLIKDSDFQVGLDRLRHYCESKPTNSRVYEQFHLFTFQKRT